MQSPLEKTLESLGIDYESLEADAELFAEITEEFNDGPLSQKRIKDLIKTFGKKGAKPQLGFVPGDDDAPSSMKNGITNDDGKTNIVSYEIDGSRKNYHITGSTVHSFYDYYEHKGWKQVNFLVFLENQGVDLKKIWQLGARYLTDARDKSGKGMNAGRNFYDLLMICMIGAKFTLGTRTSLQKIISRFEGLDIKGHEGTEIKATVELIRAFRIFNIVEHSTKSNKEAITLSRFCSAWQLYTHICWIKAHVDHNAGSPRFIDNKLGTFTSYDISPFSASMVDKAHIPKIEELLMNMWKMRQDSGQGKDRSAKKREDSEELARSNISKIVANQASKRSHFLKLDTLNLSFSYRTVNSSGEGCVVVSNKESLANAISATDDMVAEALAKFT